MRLYTVLVGMFFSTMIWANRDPIGLLELPQPQGKLKHEDFKTIEFDYEILGVQVLEQKGKEYRLLKGDGSFVWESVPNGKFYAFKDLFKRDQMFWVKANAPFFAEAGGLKVVTKPSRVTREVIGIYELGNLPIAVYSKPETKSKLLRSISNFNPWVDRLDGNCPCGAIVSEQRGPWLKLSNIRGDRSEVLAPEGWVLGNKQNLITTLEPTRLEEARTLVYKTALDDLPVKLLETQSIDDKLWAKVELDIQARCGVAPEDLGSIPNKTFWIRVFGEKSTLHFWYYPRGC